MNERIKELAEQALKSSMVHTIMYRPEGYANGVSKDFADKFAELIVVECMKVAINKDSGYMHPTDVAGYMAAGRSTAAQMIKEHFGVEE